jgi:leucyl aminopeptidase
MFKSVKVGGRTKTPVLVVGHFEGAQLDKITKERDKDGGIAKAAKSAEATGEAGRVVDAGACAGFQRVLLVGLGKKDKLAAGAFRDIAGAVARRLSATKDSGAEIDFTGPIEGAKLDDRACGQAFGEGVGLAAWVCDQFRGKATTKPDLKPLTLRADDRTFAEGLKRGLGIAESANITRTLSQTPPNICTPMYMASEARKIARETGMTCTVIKGAALEKEKLTGLVNVGKASDHEPCLIRLEYRPGGGSRGGGKKTASSRSAGKPAVLLGKTITYDSGGLSIKVGGSMKGMKRDKDGGCAVLGAMHAIATVVKPKFPVVGLLVAAENAISDEAYRPDDILTFRNGVTVEVTNTDAEGRLVLADGLCWACEKEKPRFIVDLATLTGGVVVALGSVYAGLWCDDDDLRGKVECAAEGSGERVWRLPHHADYNAMMKSPVADIVNSAPVREAHPIQGAAFLSYFVEDGVPWAHIDIAGVHATDKDKGPYIAGPTGYGVRLLAELIGTA